jgi:hypothetical protein
MMKQKIFAILSMLLLLLACSNGKTPGATPTPLNDVSPTKKSLVSSADFGQAHEVLMPDKFKDIIYEFEKGCDKGISQAGWDQFNKKNGKPVSKVCDKEVIKGVAYEYYGFHWKGFDLPRNQNHHIEMYPYMTEPLQFVMFDTRFNTGDGDKAEYANGALQMLQEVLNDGSFALKVLGHDLNVDGGWGPETFQAFKAAIKNGNEAQTDIANKVLDKREKLHCYRAIKDGAGYLKAIDGFLNRIETIRKMLKNAGEGQKIQQIKYIEKYGDNKEDGENYCREKWSL